MNKKLIIISIIIVLLCSMITISDNIQKDNFDSKGSILYVGGTGTGNYTTIQSAIDYASSGDTVFVYNGTYFENIMVNKSVFLIGQNKSNTIIWGNVTANGCTFKVTKSGFIISNFTLTHTLLSVTKRDSDDNFAINIFNLHERYGFYEGIVIDESANSILFSNCILKNYSWNHGAGLWVYSNYNHFSQCTFNNNPLYFCDNSLGKNTIENCMFLNESSLIMEKSPLNTICNNTFKSGGLGITGLTKHHFEQEIQNNSINNKPIVHLKNETNLVINNLSLGQLILFNSSNISLSNISLNQTIVGLSISYCNNITVNSCQLNNNLYGAMFYYDDTIDVFDNLVFSCETGISSYSSITHFYENIISNNDYGLDIISSTALIHENTITLSDYVAIVFAFSEGSNLYHNQIYDNGEAVYISHSNNNTIHNNKISNNEKGISISLPGDNNTIYHNTLYNNTINALDYGNNQWDNGYPSGGNYWDDYYGNDVDGDGIGNTPYDVPGGSNQDKYPLMNPITDPPVFVWIDDDFNESTPGWQSDRFNKIQDGIDAVIENGTVYVYNGTYFENVVVNKKINLKGEHRNNTIIDGNETDHALQISENFVNISSFTIRNTSLPNSGICINSNNASIFDNILISNSYAMKMINTSNCSFFNNVLFNNQADISIHESSSNTFKNNVINDLLTYKCSQLTIENNTFLNDNNFYNGVEIRYSLDCHINNNTFLSDGIAIDGNNKLYWTSHSIENNFVNNSPIYFIKNTNGGMIPSDAGQVILANCAYMTIQGLNLSNLGFAIQIGYSYNNNITNNFLSNNLGGIVLKWSFDNLINENKIIQSDEFAYYSLYSHLNTISSNFISDGEEGIGFHQSDYNTIKNNTITDSEVRAIRFYFSSNNEIIHNNLTNSFIGINIDLSSDNNIIYHNNFFNNSIHAYDTETNIWDNGYPSGGNYWDDYTDTDANGDGIGDTPYDIQGGNNQDRYPLGYFHPIADFAYSPILPDVDEPVYFNSTSFDPDGSIVNYTWYFGDSISYEMNPTYQYDDNGIYSVMLEVIDNEGRVDTVAKMIPVDFQMMPISTMTTGWNFISAPYNYSQDTHEFLIKHEEYYYNWTHATSAINPTNNPLINQYLFGWNRSVQTYTFERNLEPGYGYWMYAYQPCELWNLYDPIQPDNYVTNLELGWNIISIPDNQLVNKTDLLVDDLPWDTAVSNGWVSDFVFGWDEIGQSYVFSDVFEPGQAYWMYAYQQCVLKR